WPWPFPRFVPATGEALAVRVPASLAPADPAEPASSTAGPGEPLVARARWSWTGWSRRQATYAWPAADLARPRDDRTPDQDLGRYPAVHVRAGGHGIKPLPPRLDARDRARLRASGAVPAGAPPLPPPSGGVIEIDRTLNASGNISVGNHVISA